MKLRISIGLSAVLLVFTVVATAQDAADLVLRNGKIVTVAADNPEVRALAALDGLIIAVGSNQDISPYIGATTNVIDLDGSLAIPGFIEGHAHFMGIGDAEMQLKLGIAKNWGDIVQDVKNAAEESESGVWIRGRGWHQEK